MQSPMNHRPLSRLRPIASDVKLKKSAEPLAIDRALPPEWRRQAERLFEAAHSESSFSRQRVSLSHINSYVLVNKPTMRRKTLAHVASLPHEFKKATQVGSGKESRWKSGSQLAALRDVGTRSDVQAYVCLPEGTEAASFHVCQRAAAHIRGR